MLSLGLTPAIAALTVLSPLVSAMPWGWPSPQPRAVPSLASIKVPSNTLPPPGDLELKYLALGVGTQNYTCADDEETTAVVQPGAIATLYDIGTALAMDPWAQWKIHAITGIALNLSPWDNALQGYLRSQGYGTPIGNHFFNATGTPTFSLSKIAPSVATGNKYPLLYGKKNGTMTAPTDSCPGFDDEGAVPWIQLIDVGTSQGGISEVYRMETAGGAAPSTCDGQPKAFQVRYAAQYWFYGPKSTK